MGLENPSIDPHLRFGVPEIPLEGNNHGGSENWANYDDFEVANEPDYDPQYQFYNPYPTMMQRYVPFYNPYNTHTVGVTEIFSFNCRCGLPLKMVGEIFLGEAGGGI